MLNFTTFRNEKSEDWVTFVHGAGGSSTIWYKQVREFRKHLNVLVLDLRGHGKPKPQLQDAFKHRYTFDFLTDDIIEVIDHLHIPKSHFIGISLGTVLIRNLAERHPHRVRSMVLGGAIIKFNFRFRLFMGLERIGKNIVPYIWLYQIFTFAIMPDSNHRESRMLLIREAKKLYQREFIRWSRLYSQLSPLLRRYRTEDLGIPTLYVMGGEDYLFLPSVRKLVQRHQASSLLLIEHSGHVVNVEQPELFNQMVIQYVTGI